MKRLWLLCLAGVLLAGCAQAQSFDAATIKASKPDVRGQSWGTSNNRVGYHNVTLRQLIKVAFDLRADAQVIDGPDWIAKKKFDIEARMDDAEFGRVDKMPSIEQEQEYRLLLRHLVEERFALKTTAETRALPQFSLTVDGSGPKMAVAPENVEQNLSVHSARMDAKGVPMESLVSVLADQPEVEGHVVVNRTGLTGAYTFAFSWAPDRGTGSSPDTMVPGLFTALREQLGLKLTKGEGTVPVVVVTDAHLPEMD